MTHFEQQPSPALSQMTTPIIKHRVHANPQSKGNLGKSLETECRVAWLDHHGVSWHGSDLDDRHATFSNRHPDQTRRYKLGNEQEAKDAFLALFRGILQAPAAVHVIDTRAQADELFMAAVDELHFFELCQKHGIRTTFFLFPSDESESMQNFIGLVQFGGHAVDFVVVQNPAKSKASLYQGSRIEKALENAGARTLTVPTLTTHTLLAMERAEAKARRGISFAEFAAPESGHLEPIMAGELQWALTRMFEQYDAFAELLLPSDLAEKAKAAAKSTATRKKARFKDEDLSLNFGE